MFSEKSSSNVPKATIVTIGTEVCSGEILNSNAQWLAQRLEDFQVECVRQITIPDERKLIIQSLDLASQDSDFIFTTGGLGPTSDDFSRIVIAEWLGEDLVFDSESWQAIKDRLTTMQVPIAESNRQQCFFPAGARILKNPAGTANAFVSKSANIQIFALPGPPAEIAAIWESNLRDLLITMVPKNNKERILYWHCMGLSESRLGELVEEALANSGYKTGYRPHIPYVDVKVWIPKNVDTAHNSFLIGLEKSIAPWVVAKDGEDIAQRLISLLSKYESCDIFDFHSGGILAQRLGTLIRDYKRSRDCKINIYSNFNSQDFSTSSASTIIVLEPLADLGNWSLMMKLPTGVKTENFNFPRKIHAENYDQYLSYSVEQTIAKLNTWLLRSDQWTDA